MSNFNWNNYIGEHMSEPLRVLEPTNLTTELTYKNIGFIAESGDYVPIIRSISDLTDEELLFVFGDTRGSFISRNKNTISLGINGGGDAYLQINIKTGKINTTDQFYDIGEILNRLYSLHVSIDYDELIKNGLAVRKE